MSIRTQIRDAAIAALNTDTPTGVPSATKRRYIPGEKLIEPRIAVFFAEEEVIYPGNSRAPITKRMMTLAIQCMAGVALPEEADDAIEPLLTHVVDVMGDTNLSGIAHTIVERSTQWATADNGGRFYIVGLTRWIVEYQTKRNDLSALH